MANGLSGIRQSGQTPQQSCAHQFALTGQRSGQDFGGEPAAGNIFENHDPHDQAMEVIPVIDLMHGQVVHAQGGRRADYRPLASPLCHSADPSEVVAALLRLHRFRTFYIADLDALSGRAPQTACCLDLLRRFPELSWWIDRGLPERAEPLFRSTWPGVVPVIGSESLRDELLDVPAADFILSLDFRDGQLVGPERLLERPDWWPERVILMNLGRVGSLAGPDVAQAKHYLSRFPRHRFIGAGGVRDDADLAHLEALGLSAVLVASALHSGAITGARLDALAENRNTFRQT